MLIRNLGLGNRRFGETSGKNIMVEVVTCNHVMAETGYVADECRVVALPIRNVLLYEIGIIEADQR